MSASDNEGYRPSRVVYAEPTKQCISSKGGWLTLVYSQLFSSTLNRFFYSASQLYEQDILQFDVSLEPQRYRRPVSRDIQWHRDYRN